MKFLVDAQLPKRLARFLLLVATGNIKNIDLENILQKNLNQLVEAFENHSYIELGRDIIVIHQ